MRTFEVRDTLLTGLPTFGEDGRQIGSRAAPEKTILTEQDLAGIDIERLLALGSIAETGPPSPGLSTSEGGEESSPATREEELGLMTKAQIFDLAVKAGLDLKETKKLRKDDLIAAVIGAWDAAVESQEPEVGPSTGSGQGIQEPERPEAEAASDQSPVISNQ